MKDMLNVLLPAALIMFIVIFGIMYLTGSMADLDQGVDVEGTDYERVYESTRDTAQIGVTFMSWFPMLLGAAVLVGAAMLLYRATTRG